MKLMYVNGFRKDYKPSSTYLKLKEAGFDIDPCQWKYGDNVRTKIDNCIKKIKPEMIIASSTAGLFVTDYDIPVILINPVVDRKDLEKLFPDKDFSNYPIKPSNKSSEVYLFLGEKDEKLDYKKAKEFFKNAEIIVLKNERHRLKNIEPLIEYLKNYVFLGSSLIRQINFLISYIEKFEKEEITEEIMANFSKDFHRTKLVYKFPWSKWQDEAKKYYKHPQLLSTADLTTIRKLLTLHIRKNRFVDWHLKAIIKSGNMIQILNRLKQIRDELAKKENNDNRNNDNNFI